MNQYFYETRGKEKIKELLREGQASQALQKARAPKHEIPSGAPKHVTLSKLALNLLGILAFLGLRVR